MKMPDKFNNYCPKCKKHTVHKAKLWKKGKVRSMSAGQRRHDAKTRGYTSKIAGKVKVYKQGKRATLMLTCQECKKKYPKTIATRARKPLELIRVE